MTTKIPRGIRNNNPGNIDYNPVNDWRGQLAHVPTIEPRFCRFDSPQNGIRALGKLLLNYQRKHGLKTVRQIVNRWAPPKENDTGAYVSQVAKALGIDPDAPIDLSKKHLSPLVVSIIKHENGQQPYSAEVIGEGVRRALA
ncbi:hypothetical protein [Pseudomonas sp. TTU2014-080ASC]|uniref:hypothetical protein n=1 Tax=Pseudomonas sp. TTU2014-080ASC TaxID=1729724 RepID=UPI0007184E5B|nr:hypothetical protein [Pseudomonas sp. TTU2014-080ASC]KRW62322.1 hypothetical protein AO726_02555 [Pseudomonas sp. TTU2014-080ASC]